jgi:DNA mismatch repair protein MutS2
MDQLIKRRERRDERKREREITTPKLSATIPAIKEDNLPLKSGDKVRIKGGDLIGEILRMEGSVVSVAIGSVISKLSPEKLERISNKEYSGILKGSSSRVFSVRESEDITQRKLNFKPTIDIRGERLEQAIDSVTRFVDDAVMVGVGEIKILHGKGNGILREELRKYLKTMGGVASFRDEQLQMGGSGITVVTLDN